MNIVTEPMTPAKDLITTAKTAVVKVGSALITKAPDFSMGGLVADMIEQDWTPVLVSSGAIAVGHEQAPFLDPEATEDKHALSAIGQATLIMRWQAAFGAHNALAAQVLLTPDVTDDRRRYLNARAAIRVLMSHQVVPIVNENDAVTTRKFRYGDNDRLAAKTAGLVDADLLIILSDVDGLYTCNPVEDPSAEHVAFVPYGAAGQYLEAATEAGVGVGTGGMKAKLAAARVAIEWGVTTIIASGRRRHPIRDLLSGDARCTVFEAGTKMSARKRWLSGVHERAGGVDVDAGAVRALKKDASLLSVGVSGILDRFLRGDVIEIRHENEVVGFGLAAADFDKIQSREVEICIRKDDIILTITEDDDHD